MWFCHGCQFWIRSTWYTICGYSQTKPATATSRGSHGHFLSCTTCLGLPYLQPRGIPSTSSRMPHWHYNMPYSPMSPSSATTAAPTFSTFTGGAGRWYILTKVDFIETTLFFVQIESMLCDATVVVWCYIPNENVLNLITIHTCTTYDLQKHPPHVYSDTKIQITISILLNCKMIISSMEF